MLKPINELDKAEFKVQMRQMYQKIGYAGMLQCLYEIIQSANLLIEVMIEEGQNENS